MGLLSPLDWQQPWYRPWADVGQAVGEAMTDGSAVHGALNRVAAAWQVNCPRFVSQSALVSGQAYESHVAERWECPTRDNLHDYFNGLCWLKFPQTKRRLNQLQSAQIQRDGIQGRRGPVRDAITLLDESAALLCAPEPIWQALCAKDWQRLFITLRPLWAESSLLLFGHASLERLVVPRKPMVSHVYIAKYAIHFEADAMQNLDQQLAQDLDEIHLATKPFAPLPLMGVPGWCEANSAPDFYADTRVFRVSSP